MLNCGEDAATWAMSFWAGAAGEAAAGATIAAAATRDAPSMVRSVRMITSCIGCEPSSYRFSTDHVQCANPMPVRLLWLLYRIRTDMSALQKTRLSRLVVGRRRRFVVVATWVLVAAALGPLAGRFEGAQENEPSTFLPGDAESVKVLEASKGFPSVSRRPPSPSSATRRASAQAAERPSSSRARSSAPQGSRASRASHRSHGRGTRPPPSSSVPIAAGGDADLLVSAVERVHTRSTRGSRPASRRR